MLKVFEPAKGRNYDIGVILSAVFLTAVGVLMVYSTSSVYSMENFGDPNYYLKRHAMYLALGLVGMFAVLCVDYRVFRKLVYPAYFIGLAILVAVLVIGKDVGGARRWIDLGAFTFQPSEIAKYIIVLYLAHSLTKKRDKVDSFVVGFASHILIAGVYVILILLEPDFGTATTIIVVLFAMMFIGEVRIRYLVPLGLISVALLVVAVLTKGYRMRRITAYMDPWQDPLGAGYQSIQSFIAFALGGIYGTGLGDSAQKLFFLPQAHTDFIFSIIGEELGFIGVVLVILGFVVLLVRSLRVSLRAPDLFGCYLVFGCVVLITLQAGMNMAVAVGLFPTKGLTLPFISYGGTSLITSLTAVGIILNVSPIGNKMRIIIAGGGTGGHVFPAISIAQEISNNKHGDEILFVGTKRGMENELVSKNGYEIRHISSRGFVGRGLFNTIIAFFYALKGLFESITIIKSFNPNVVLGVGGYVSGPLVLAAWILRIPTAICEQNTVPGVTNRILGKLVNKIFTSFDSSVLYFPSKKVLITGNPIRQEILESSNSSKNAGPISVLIFGGSQGASSLNNSVPEAFSKVDIKNIVIVHQTGKKDFENVKNLYSENGIDAEVLIFIDNMADAYNKCDLVIGRSGAGTIAEITSLGKPSILVPFPYAAHNHQFENAKVLQSADAAVLIEDKDATSEKLALTLTNLLHEDKLNDMALNAKKLGKPRAAKEIVDELYKLAGDI